MAEGTGPGLIVEAAGQRWLVPAAQVVEVLRTPAIVRIPGAVPSVRGMVNHRGRILTVADLVRALGLPDELPAAPVVVVVTLEGRRFAIAVAGVVELAADARTGLATLALDQIAAAIFP